MREVLVWTILYLTSAGICVQNKNASSGTFLPVANSILALFVLGDLSYEYLNKK